MFDWRIILAGGALAAAGALANGHRWENKYLGLQLEHAAELAQRKDATVAAIMEDNAAVVTAVREFQARNTANLKDYEKLSTSMASLARTVGGLRGDFADMPRFVRDGTREGVGRFATACTDVFERMAAGGQRLGETGSRIAQSADEHYAREALGGE